MNSLRLLAAAALATGALSLSSCETYVADGYAYGGGYAAPVATAYVAPRPYCAPTYYGASYYGGGCSTPRYYAAPCYTPRYCAPSYSSCDYGYSHGHGHYSGHSHGGYYGGGCRY